MMRKKQIFRMLVGALAVCLTAACSNETEVLNGFPTDGNTISVSLRTNDIGAHTRTMIASADELSVENLSAYLFAEGEDGEYQLEKVYDNLTWNDDEETHTVALTGIAERGPKKVYFVANGASIGTLPEGTTEPTLSEEDFQALLMSEMTANPSTPLPMTAQAELAEWGKGVNNAIIEGPVLLKRVSARIDLKVDSQEGGLIFVPTSIALSAAANSYIFPNETVYEEGEETVEISGTTLYPYETADGTVEAVKVTGKVTVGETTKDVTFTVPFVDEDGSTIAIQRNHRYTVHITKINGFYSAEATVTVSDWSAADGSGNLQAGEDLKMTATEEIEGTLAIDPAATAIYPDNETKSAVVELTAEDIKTYKIWVGSANIEAITTWSELLPEGWEIAEPASTRAEYLWEKSYWTLTIPANQSPDTKSLTIKAVNKLELAMDEETKKYVQITFEQAGKEEEEVDHSKNPLLKWAKADLVYNKNNQTSSFASAYTTQGSLYQWGRNTGWSNYKDALGSYDSGTVTYKYGTYNSAYKTGTGITNGYDHESQRYTKVDQIKNNPSFYLMDADGTDYWTFGNGGSTWQERASLCGFTTDVCPEGWRMPTKADFLAIKPSEPLRGSNDLASVINNLVELKKIENVCSYAIRWSAETTSGKTYLRIDALVVPDNFQEGSLTSINWNTDENVVTRYFGANGFIRAFKHINIVSSGQQFPVARPMPGVETHTDRLWQVGNLWTVLWDYITDYSVNNDGYYWMSDEKSAFTFNDNTRVKNVWFGGKYPFSNRQSVLGILPTNAQDCCAIRCITDNPVLQAK